MRRFRYPSIIRNSVPVQAALIAIILVVLIFPDVLFRGAHLRFTDQYETALRHERHVEFYPHADTRQWWQSYSDAGGAMWQAEPMMEFTRQALKKGESPYWDPYSAGGELGPETLVDEKLSYVALIYSALGGGIRAFDLVYLAAYAAAAFFVVRIVRERLGLSALSGTTAAIFYLLNGYATANYGSNVTQNYLVIPTCLYFALGFVADRSLRNYAWLLLSASILLTCTFLPTTTVAVMVICALTFIYGCDIRLRTYRPVMAAFGWTCAVGGAFLAAAFVIDAFIYWPFLESIADTATLNFYEHRQFNPVFWPGLLTLFSSSHFFEAYTAIDPKGLGLVGQLAYHFGIIPFALASAVLPLTRRLRWTVIGATVLIAITLMRLFAMPGINLLFDIFPIIRNLGDQYLWAGIAVPMTLLVAIGMENVLLRRVSLLPVLMLLAVGASLAVAVGHVYGPSLDRHAAQLRDLWVMGLTAAFGVAALWRANLCHGTEARRVIGQALMVVCFVELMGDAKFMRTESNDYFHNSPPEVSWLQQNLGNYRMMTIGVADGAPPEQGSAFHLADIGALNVGTLPAYNIFFHEAIVLDPQDMWTQIDKYAESQDRKHFDFNGWGLYPTLGNVKDMPSRSVYDWEKLSLLGVKYVVMPAGFVNYHNWLESTGIHQVFATPQTAIYENPWALPHSFAVTSYHPENGDVELSVDDLQNMAPVGIDRYHNATVRLSGHADKPQLVVLTDNWHRNWTARLNGTRVPILKVDGTLRGIEVPAGDFQVTMRYMPKSLPFALAVGTAGLIALLFALLKPSGVARLLDRRRAAPAEPAQIVNS